MAYTEIIECAKASGELKTSSTEVAWSRSLLSGTKTGKKLLRTFIFHTLIFVLLLVAAMFLLDNPLIAGSSDPHQTRAFYPTTLNFWVALGVASSVYVLLGLTFIHRVAGALVQFRQAFKLITEGNLPVRFSIRESDYPQEEAEIFAEALCALQASQAREYDRRAELRVLLHELEDSDHKQSKEIVAKMKALLTEETADD